jgi:hypothetical protein
VPGLDSSSWPRKLARFFSLGEFHLGEEKIVLEKLMSDLHENESYYKDEKYYDRRI